jgi:hypothetical protein
MPIQKLSFEESLELPEMTDSERQELDDLKESEDYYNSALTAAQRDLCSRPARIATPTPVSQGEGLSI